MSLCVSMYTANHLNLSGHLDDFLWKIPREKDKKTKGPTFQEAPKKNIAKIGRYLPGLTSAERRQQSSHHQVFFGIQIFSPLVWVEKISS